MTTQNLFKVMVDLDLLELVRTYVSRHARRIHARIRNVVVDRTLGRLDYQSRNGNALALTTSPADAIRLRRIQFRVRRLLMNYLKKDLTWDDSNRGDSLAGFVNTALLSLDTDRNLRLLHMGVHLIMVYPLSFLNVVSRVNHTDPDQAVVIKRGERDTKDVRDFLTWYRKLINSVSNFDEYLQLFSSRDAQRTVKKFLSQIPPYYSILNRIQ